MVLQAREDVISVGAGSIVFGSAVDGAVNGFPSRNSAFEFGYFLKACCAEKIGSFGGLLVVFAVDVDIADGF